MKLYVIGYFNKNNVFQHGACGDNADDMLKYWELIKQTRSAEKIPIARFYEVELPAPVEMHVKET